MMQIQNLAGTCECTRLYITTSSGRECQFTYNIIDSTCKQVYLLYMNHTCKMQMVQKAKFPEMYRTGRNFLHLKSWSFAGYRCTKVYRKLCPILLQDGSGNVMFFGESAGFQACTVAGNLTFRPVVHAENDINNYCFLISTDISVLHSNCTGSDSSPTVQIFFLSHTRKYYCTLVIAH